MRTLPLLLIMLLFAAATGMVCAEEALDLSALIGLTLEEACQSLGAPLEVYPLRGTEPGQDDVVFYYPRHLYLFWFQNRVWQARTDGRYQGTVFSVSMGASRQRVLEVMGRPFQEFEDSLVFHIEDRGYPVQARFYFEDERLSDVYCFRGDL
ncbi:hypothetical protein ES708_12721 [subsurface metagenome]